MHLWQSEINQTLDRSLRILGPQKTPLRWAAVVPAFPIAQIVPKHQCVELHQEILQPDIVPRTVPGGTIAVLTTEERDTWVQTGVTSVGLKGTVLGCEYAVETRKGRFVEYAYTLEFLESIFQAGSQLYQTLRVSERPLYLAVGIRNASACRIQSTGERVGRPFPDDEYLHGVGLSVASLVTDFTAAKAKLCDELSWSFDIAPELP